MSAFDIYVLVLCLIVFVSLTALFACLVITLVRQAMRLIAAGLEDEKIKIEYEKANNKKAGCVYTVVDRVISIIICCIVFVFFAFSVYVELSGAPVSDTVPTLSVVQSGSMSYVNEKNERMAGKNIGGQFKTYDLILLYKLPAVEDLKLYDIVLYEVEGTPIVHRIVGIEPPTGEEGEYKFLLQGDALENPDRFPVYYSQMRGIYRGERVPFIGSFIAFMQSVAGYLCILLIIFAIVTIPIVEKRVNAAKKERLKEIGFIPSEEEEK